MTGIIKKASKFNFNQIKAHMFIGSYSWNPDAASLQGDSILFDPCYYSSSGHMDSPSGSPPAVEEAYNNSGSITLYFKSFVTCLWQILIHRSHRKSSNGLKFALCIPALTWVDFLAKQWRVRLRMGWFLRIFEFSYQKLWEEHWAWKQLKENKPQRLKWETFLTYPETITTTFLVKIANIFKNELFHL